MTQNGQLNGVPVAYCFMRSEVDPHLEFFYGKFKEHNEAYINKTKVIFLDKDLHNLRMISKFFDYARILLCVFHVLKWLRQRIYGDKYLYKDGKDAIWSHMKTIVYAIDETEFNAEYEKLVATCTRYEQKDVLHKEQFAAYFEK